MIALCAPVVAQEPDPPAPVVSVGRTTLDVHTESTSRELFSACDADGDDRLDLFEASDAIETLGDPKDSRPFLELDTNRDGFLQWPEFDSRYRSAIERTGTFQVRTCRRFVHHAPELRQAKAATPLEVFLQLNDTNKNGGLDPEEISKIARDIGLLPVLETQLKLLDRDKSGLIEHVELAPWFEQIRNSVTLPGVSELPNPSTLPPPWGEIDGNGDTRIDLAELTAALRRIDPGLQRWAEAILAKLDKNGDQQLIGTELQGTGRGPEPDGDGAPSKTTSVGVLNVRRRAGN